MKTRFGDRIFSIKNQSDFLNISLDIFRYQYLNNSLYRTFTDNLGVNWKSVDSLQGIPFMPVEFFRDHKILTGELPAVKVFESSGTTGTISSRHFVADLDLYEQSFLKTFRLFYGAPDHYVIVALLPSYVERHGSSLVYMADKLIQESGHSLSGFYRPDTIEILNVLRSSDSTEKKILLLGVSFALLDLAENYSLDLSEAIVMETGGMKGRRKELTRQELHSILKSGFNVSSIHSEYGMTELLSQAYSKDNGIFYSPPWMKLLIRDPLDPLSVYSESGRTGGINVIDLANLNSCSFIATGDLGKLYDDGGFEVLGRFDNSDIRGCNLLAE
jgi:phenylacetate-coenzyme A ligase PaaK-like adenylate-forming protein